MGATNIARRDGAEPWGSKARGPSLRFGEARKGDAPGAREGVQTKINVLAPASRQPAPSASLETSTSTDPEPHPQAQCPGRKMQRFRGGAGAHTGVALGSPGRGAAPEVRSEGRFPPDPGAPSSELGEKWCLGAARDPQESASSRTSAPIAPIFAPTSDPEARRPERTSKRHSLRISVYAPKRAPTVRWPPSAQKFSRSCSGSRGSARVRRALAEFGRVPKVGGVFAAVFGQVRSTRQRSANASARLGAKMAQFCQSSPNLGPTEAPEATVCQLLDEFGATSELAGIVGGSVPGHDLRVAVYILSAKHRPRPPPSQEPMLGCGANNVAVRPIDCSPAARTRAPEQMCPQPS